MANREWSDQYKHPSWQRKRLEALEFYGWVCTDCGDKDKTLHVHHRRYVKGRKLWDYTSEELNVLCEDCHKDEHYIRDELAELLMYVDVRQALALLRGFTLDDSSFEPWIGDAGRDRDPHTYAIGVIAMLLKYVRQEEYASVAKFIADVSHKNSESKPLEEKHRYAWTTELGIG